jgi:hypothetical protein
MRNFASVRRNLFAALGFVLISSVAQSAAGAVIGGAVIVQGTEDVIATYRGNSANFSDDLYLFSPNGVFSTTIIFNNHASPVGTTVNLGSFAAGTELIFRLHVNNTNEDWFTGDATRNSDGDPHARVTDNWLPGETLVEFEDLRGIPPDNNGPYNDLSFSFTNTATTIPNPVPEPGTYALFVAGILMMLGIQRSRRSP